MQIVKMIFGSHLYGTNTPNSDTDYKGIFLPSKRDILLGRIPKSINTTTKKGNGKNSDQDVDTEIYSLHYFIKLALEGQTVALDMLHANSESIIESSIVWNQIVASRHRFYTRNLQAFIGYARRQASKYGIKGSRLNAAQNVMDVLQQMAPESKLHEVWDMLPTSEHLYHVGQSPNGIRQYQVCGKILQETQTAGHTLDMLKKFYESYGARAKQAEENKGIDWKAVSHAMRAAIQVKELLTRRTITFPLVDADLLLAIKQGRMDYTTEVAPMLEALMDEVEELSRISDLPMQADREYWENFVIRTVCNYVL